MLRVPCFHIGQAEEVGREPRRSEEQSSPVPTNAQHGRALLGHDDMMDVAEDLRVDLQREMLFDRANTVEYGAEEVNAGFVLGDRTAQRRTAGEGEDRGSDTQRASTSTTPGPH